MVRGAVLIDLAEERDWWPAVEGFATHQAASCSAQARNGLTEALLIALGDRPDVMHDELQRIASPTDRQAVWALVEQRLVEPPTP